MTGRDQAQCNNPLSEPCTREGRGARGVSMTSRLHLLQYLLRSPSLFPSPSPGGHRVPVLPSKALRVRSSARVRT